MAPTLSFKTFINHSTVVDACNFPIQTTSDQRVPRLFDWDNDGKLDLLVGSGNFIWLHRNVGTTTVPSFAFGVKVLDSIGNAISSGDAGWTTFALFDMNGDGAKDVVVAVTDGSFSLIWYKNTATAGSIPVFSAPHYSLFTLPLGPRFDVGDWNGDGKPDIITGSSCGGSSLYLYNSTIGDKIMFNDEIQLFTETCYNWYPRLIDITYDGVTDIVRGINSTGVISRTT